MLHLGFSDYPVWLIARAEAMAELSRLTRPSAIQVEYNLAAGDGTIDTGSVRRSEAVTHFAKYDAERPRAVAQEVVQVAAELGCTPSQLAIAWLRHQSAAQHPDHRRPHP